MKMPWVKSSRSTISLERKRQQLEYQGGSKNGANNEQRFILEEPSVETFTLHDLHAIPRNEVVWDGSDGFDVSPIPSFRSLVPCEREDGSGKHFKILGLTDQPGEIKSPRDDNRTLGLLELNIGHGGSPLSRNVSRIASIDSSESCSNLKVPRIPTIQSATQTRATLASHSSRKLSRAAMHQITTKINNSTESRSTSKSSRITMDVSAVKTSGSSDADKNTATGRALLASKLRDLMSVSTTGADPKNEGKDKYSVPESGRPVRPTSVLADNLSMCISKLDDSVAFDPYDPDWRAGQELHLERERLRLQFSKSLTVDSNDLSRNRDPLNHDGCVRFSWNPFHFSCGASGPNMSPANYFSRSGWSTSDDEASL